METFTEKNKFYENSKPYKTKEGNLVEYGKPRICSKCGKEKLLIYENFRPYKNKKGELRWHVVCRECERKYTREYCNANETWKRSQVRAYQKKYRKENKEAIRTSFYMRKHGISMKDVRAMAEKQDHECAICKNPIDFKNKHSFHVDHCHNGGGIRGILCNKCNRGIGFFNDDPELLQNAINYLTI